jgi:hypothetical protein
MKTAVCCATLCLLAGCTVVPTEAWTFDPTRPPTKAVLPAQELAALSDRIASLQLQRNEIRTRIAGQPDPRQRQQLYSQLHDLGMQLAPLERRMATVVSGR